jgi:hypothetical protein
MSIPLSVGCEQIILWYLKHGISSSLLLLSSTRKNVHLVADSLDTMSASQDASVSCRSLKFKHSSCILSTRRASTSSSTIDQSVGICISRSLDFGFIGQAHFSHRHQLSWPFQLQSTAYPSLSASTLRLEKQNFLLDCEPKS